MYIFTVYMINMHAKSSAISQFLKNNGDLTHETLEEKQ